MALTASQRAFFEAQPDPRRNVLSIDELRRVETIHERFSEPFRHLQAPAPPAMKNERPADYERRLASTLVDETARALSRADRQQYSPDERALVRAHSLTRSRAAIDAIGEEAFRGIAETAARVAASLARDPGQGSFSRPGATRMVTDTAGGHIVNSYYGNSGEWLKPYYHQGVTVAGGLLSRMMADPSFGFVRRQAPPPAYAAPPPSFGPQPALMAMIKDAVAAALPARRARK